MSDIKRLGVIVRKYRKLRGMSTQELASKVNVSVGLINNIENSKNDVFKLKLLNTLMSNLSIPIGEIFQYYNNKSLANLNKHNTNGIEITFTNTTLTSDECLLECIENLINELIGFLGQFDDEEMALKIITTYFRRTIDIMNQLYSK